ncbi:hypothetical protein [Photobacterium leiognathi]|uniref:hypothetical protein n=1 Tax=Photobacterium leiognathi TaxID=553611 RepID=UPI0029813C3F|nr:hypothetical protein [Photobacterium leiognathi]
MKKILHIVHCIDTEGPLTEDLDATFERLKNIFKIELEPTKENLEKIQSGNIVHEKKNDIMKVFSKELLKYNNSWKDIDVMLDYCMSSDFRNSMQDDFGQGWIYSWHCMDHAGYKDNPRRKDTGFGNVFKFYQNKISETNSNHDEINWHFHPLSFDRNPLKAATSYYNSMDILLEVICRRVIEERWYPATNRPGFHSERPDSHLFLEQWIPFDYANQRYDYDDGQEDLIEGRFGDWRRAPKSWCGYHPSIWDYQAEGNCKRVIFRCLNVGTRFNLLTEKHVREAFEDANVNGKAILAFADHDYRDIAPDVQYIQKLINDVKNEYPDVKVKFSGATEAARDLKNYNINHEEIKTQSYIKGNKLIIDIIKGELFSSQPFLALKDKSGHYYHDNLDVIDFGNKYQYVFDDQTLKLDSIDKIGIASVDRLGFTDINIINL